DTTYGYDGNGVRTSKDPGNDTNGSQKTLYLNDANSPAGYSKALEERDTSGNVKVTYVLGHDILGQAKASESHVLKYFLKDGHGSTRALANAGGTVAERYDFQAFGEPVAGFNPDAADTTALFADGPRAAGTGVTYSLSRFRR